MTRLYLFDADSTLRRCTVPGQPCPNRPGEWELLPDVKARLAEIDWATTAAGIVSNQAGVAAGHMAESVAHGMLVETLVAATGEWCPFWPVMLCPHAPTAGCECRKPAPQMLLQAVDRVSPPPFAKGAPGLRIKSLDEVLYVGDQLADHAAAEAAGMPFQWAHDFFRWAPPADPGIVWEGTVFAYGARIKARLFGGPEGKVCIWTEGGWHDATSRVRPAILSAARAGRPFWAKAASGPGPA